MAWYGTRGQANGKGGRRIALFWSLLAGVFALDRLSKVLAEALLKGNAAQIWLPHLLEVRYTENQGMALGILSGHAAAGLLLPLAAVGGWVLVLRRYRGTGYTRVANALVLGGFLGNFTDRLLQGYVVDMLYFPFLPWFVCNLADIAICAGVGMLIVSLLIRPQDWRDRHASEKCDRAA